MQREKLREMDNWTAIRNVVWGWTVWSKGCGPNWYQIEKKACYIPKVCKFYVKKGSLACKSIFHRPKHNTNVGPHVIEFQRNAEMKYTKMKYTPLYI